MIGSFIDNVRAAAAFGDSKGDRLRLGRYYAQMCMSERFASVRAPAPIRVPLAPDGHQVVISDPGELAALRHIFREGEYAVAGTPEVIFDLGANVGLATLYFSRCFPEALIVSVEGDPRTYARLCENVARLPNVIPLNLALTGTDGPVSFHSSPYSLWSGLSAEASDTVDVTVEGITLNTLLARIGVERVGLIKLDIEGAEFDVFRTSCWENVDEVVGEIHYDLVTGADESTVRRYLRDFDVTLVPHGSERSLLYARRHT